MKLGAALLGAVIFFGANVASAALTSSERGQIKDFVAAARLENVHKVRSLVARTDLTPEESATALTDAVVSLPFTDARGVFLKELAFGGASAASRPIVVLAEVKALLARADAIYERHGASFERDSSVIRELVAIYGWIDTTIANAGTAAGSTRDGSSGIPPATYEGCSKALRDHVERQARWLRGDGVVPEPVGRLRAQAQVLVFDMLPDGVTRKVDAADRLALKGARRSMLTDWGILLSDDGRLEDALVERVRQVLARLPGARDNVSLIYVGKPTGASEPPLRARAAVVVVAPLVERYPFTDEAPHAKYDPKSSAIVHDLAVLAARRAFASNAELLRQAERDAAAAGGAADRLLGLPRAPSVEHVIGAAIHALMVDAPRAIDLALGRLLGGRPETAAILSDALGVLASSVNKEKDGPKIELGRAGDFTTVSAVRLAPNGTAIGFTTGGHAWTIDRASPSYVVMGARRDGAPVTVQQLTSKGIPRDGTRWTDAGYTFSKLRGAPRVAVFAGTDKNAGPTVKLAVGGTDGYDAIAIAPPAADFVVEGTLTVRDGPGGIAFRVTSTKKGLRGGALVVAPGARATLSVIEDDGETQLSAPVESLPSGAIPVKISVRGATVDVQLGKSKMTGTLPESLGKGAVGIVGKSGANVEIAGFTLKRQ